MTEATMIHTATLEWLEAVMSGQPAPASAFTLKFATNPGGGTISPALVSRYGA